MNNLEVAATLREIADLLEWQGEEPFKVRAYRNAAQVLALAIDEVTDLCQNGRLTVLPGIGKSIARKVNELVTTGQSSYLAQLRATVPPGLSMLLRVPGVDVSLAQRLYARLGVDSLDRLEQVASGGQLRSLPGVGAREESQILAGLQKLRQRDL
jgi:DNA polymerase (family 10)